MTAEKILAGRGVGAAMLSDLGGAVVAADHQFGEGLVVAQHDVEARLQLLDEVGFQQQGLGLGCVTTYVRPSTVSRERLKHVSG